MMQSLVTAVFSRGGFHPWFLVEKVDDPETIATGLAVTGARSNAGATEPATIK
jgi:hypothetical protein